MQKVRVLALVLFVIALIPRVYDLGGHSMNADEPMWAIRGVDFTEKALRGDFRNCNEKFECHPGTPAALLIGISSLALGRVMGPVSAARFPIAVSGALCCVILYLLSRKIWSEEISFAAGLFMAISPFHTALSRVAHQDAMLTFFLMVAILTYYLGEQDKLSETKYKVISGIFFGLGVLTKLTAILMLPLLVSWKVLINLKDKGLGQTLKFWTVFNRRDILVLLTGMAVFFALYPKMWFNQPLSLLEYVGGNMFQSQSGAANFFRGTFTTSPPNYFYLVTTSLRATEILLICFIAGLISGIVYLVRRRSFVDSWMLIFLWGAFYFAFLSMLSLKGDRYMLLVWPVLCLVAAAGLLNLTGKLFPGRAGAAAVSVIALFSLWPMITYSPNYYLYYNSLVGGPKGAKEIVQIGWGEGLKESMDYITRTSGPGKKVAVFGYDYLARRYYNGSVLNAQEDDWQKCDYLVVSMPMSQRYPELPAAVYARNRKPTHTIVLNNIEMAWIYKL